MVNYSGSRLDEVFSALSDATRRAMVSRLAAGSMSVKELAEPFDMSAPAVSKHLKVLEKAGLLKRKIEGRTHHCYLVAESLQEVTDWLGYFRRFWDESLDSLESLLEQSGSTESNTDEVED